MKSLAHRTTRPEVKADPDDRVRISRLLPWALLILASVGGLSVLFLTAFRRPSPRRPPSSESAAIEAPLPAPLVTWSPPRPVQQAPRDSGLAEKLFPTETILSQQGPECLSCARTNGCLDPDQGGGACEQVFGNAPGCGAGMTERDMCVKILRDVFTSKCAESLQQAPCVCGDVPIMACLDGSEKPRGPVYADYACDFNTTDMGAIQKAFTDSNFGAGHANSLVQCVAGNGCECFGKQLGPR
jgi:hypothetical protein